MATLHVGLAPNGLQVGNFRSLQSDIDAVAFLEAADRDLHVNLPGTGYQKVLRLRVAVEAQREVFFEEFVQGVAHTVFVVAALRFHGKGDGGLGVFDGRELHHRRLVCQCVAG